MTNELVQNAQNVFMPVWQQTNGNDGYVSFELDPLLDDPNLGQVHEDRVAQYVALGRRWSKGHQNRMIKVPATPAGLDALPTLAAEGVTLNVTLIFSPRQYVIARDAIWRGAQQRAKPDTFKSVYSIFVSRQDVYTAEHVPQLSEAAQGLVGIVIAKRIWAQNKLFWQDKKLPLEQEMIFASTGTKNPHDPPDKYVEAFAGSDIETNPPKTNDAVEKLGKIYRRNVDQLPSDAILDEIDCHVDMQQLETVLMAEGVRKFADPHKALLGLIAEKRLAMADAQKTM
jgi:transaldolase